MCGRDGQHRDCHEDHEDGTHRNLQSDTEPGVLRGDGGDVRTGGEVPFRWPVDDDRCRGRSGHGNLRLIGTVEIAPRPADKSLGSRT